MAFASSASASSIGVVKERRTAATLAAGANCPRVFLRKDPANSSNCAGSARVAASLSSRLRTGVAGNFSSMTRRAKLTPAATASPSITAFRMPNRNASQASAGLPERQNSSAFSGPIRRGSRWVPPAPANSPSVISGKPTLAVGIAMRKWQPSATSKPPPSAVPWIAATIGFGDLSSATITCCNEGSSFGLPNSVMSAPAKKVRPAQASTIALTASSDVNASSALTRPSRTTWPSALTGGLSDSIIPISPSTHDEMVSFVCVIAGCRRLMVRRRRAAQARPFAPHEGCGLVACQAMARAGRQASRMRRIAGCGRSASPRRRRYSRLRERTGRRAGGRRRAPQSRRMNFADAF